MHRVFTACILALVLASPANVLLPEGAGEPGKSGESGILSHLFSPAAPSPVRRVTDYEFDLDTGDIVEVVYVTFDTMVTLDGDAFYEPHGCPVFRAVFTNTATSQWYLAVYAFEPGQTESVFTICIPEGVYEVRFPETDRYDLTGDGITIDTAELSDGPLVIRDIGTTEHTDWSGCSGTDYR